MRRRAFLKTLVSSVAAIYCPSVLREPEAEDVTDLILQIEPEDSPLHALKVYASDFFPVKMHKWQEDNLSPRPRTPSGGAPGYFTQGKSG